MVFRGKPSGACQPCRQRRIKCDKKPAGCASCARSGVVCWGYRDIEQIRFCNETEPVSKKYHHGRRRDSKAGSLTPSPRPLSPSTDDLAVAVFNIHYEYTQDVAASPCATHGQNPLLDCMKALGLATYSHLEHTPRYNPGLELYYASALRSTNVALKSACCARQNNTLLSVMMLSNLETILGGPGVQPLDGWSAHVQGSVALLELRGAQQLTTIHGRFLFMQALANLMSNCFHTGTAIPASVSDLIATAGQYIAPDTYEMALYNVTNARLAMSKYYNHIINDIPFDHDTAVQEALNLDEPLKQPVSLMRGSLHEDENSRTSPEVKYSPETWDFVSAQSQTAILVVRLTLHLLIAKLTRHVTTSSAQYEASNAILSSLKYEILSLATSAIYSASKYQKSNSPHTNRLLYAQAAVSNSAATSADRALIHVFADGNLEEMRSQDEHILRLSHGYHVIWALVLVGQLAEKGSLYRNMARELLMKAGRNLGIRQAVVLAGPLGDEVGSEQCRWE